MDYGDRQQRAEFLINALRNATKDFTYTDHKGKEYSPVEVANEIENETEIGKSIVAVAGLLFFAIRKSHAICET